MEFLRSFIIYALWLLSLNTSGKLSFDQSKKMHRYDKDNRNLLYNTRSKNVRYERDIKTIIIWGGGNIVPLVGFSQNAWSCLSLLRTGIHYNYFFRKWFGIACRVALFGDAYLSDDGGAVAIHSLSMCSFEPLRVVWSYNGDGIRPNKSYLGGSLGIMIPVGYIEFSKIDSSAGSAPKYYFGYFSEVWLTVNLVLFEMISPSGFYMNLSATQSLCDWPAIPIPTVGITVGYHWKLM